MTRTGNTAHTAGAERIEKLSLDIEVDPEAERGIGVEGFESTMQCDKCAELSDSEQWRLVDAHTLRWPRWGGVNKLF